jgi:hypothetical protein
MSTFKQMVFRLFGSGAFELVAYVGEDAFLDKWISARGTALRFGIIKLIFIHRQTSQSVGDQLMSRAHLFKSLTTRATASFAS